MARKLKDLENFIETLRMRGFKRYISIDALRYQIAKEFGTSPYTIRNIINNLNDFGLVSIVGLGSYQIIGKKTKNEREAEAKKEANDLIEKLGD